MKTDESSKALLLNPRQRSQKGNSTTVVPSGQKATVSKVVSYCTHCNKPFHLEKDCFIKHPELKKDHDKKDEEEESKTPAH